jgi:hypothetical protein
VSGSYERRTPNPSAIPDGNRALRACRRVSFPGRMGIRAAMIFKRRSGVPRESIVLVIDAFGFASKIKKCDTIELARLSDQLDRQYHRFRAKIPLGIVLVTPSRVFGTREFSTFRLNDMFVLIAKEVGHGALLRHLVASSLIFHTHEFEDYEAALRPGSQSRSYFDYLAPNSGPQADG